MRAAASCLYYSEAELALGAPLRQSRLMEARRVLPGPWGHGLLRPARREVARWRASGERGPRFCGVNGRERPVRRIMCAGMCIEHRASASSIRIPSALASRVSSRVAGSRVRDCRVVCELLLGESVGVVV